jgi:inhibitor of cysteine peptidase
MKKLIFVFVAVILSFADSVAGTVKTKTDAAVDFQRYESYFEKNDSGLKGATSYLVLTGQQQFDKVFGPAATMGTNTFLPQDAFKTKIIVAAIKRGSLRRYSDIQVTANSRILTVSYSAADDQPGRATFRSPLILSVEKGKYKEVVFVENGKKHRTVKIAR